MNSLHCSFLWFCGIFFLLCRKQKEETHFVRNPKFKVATEKLQGPLRHGRSLSSFWSALALLSSWVSCCKRNSKGDWRLGSFSCFLFFSLGWNQFSTLLFFLILWDFFFLGLKSILYIAFFSNFVGFFFWLWTRLYTVPPLLQEEKTIFLRQRIQAFYHSRSNYWKISFSMWWNYKGNVWIGSWISLELLDDPCRLLPSICMYVVVSKIGQRKEKGIYGWRICTDFSSSLFEPKIARRLFPSCVVRPSFVHLSCANTSLIGIFSCFPFKSEGWYQTAIYTCLLLSLSL